MHDLAPDRNRNGHEQTWPLPTQSLCEIPVRFYNAAASWACHPPEFTLCTWAVQPRTMWASAGGVGAFSVGCGHRPQCSHDYLFALCDGLLKYGPSYAEHVHVGMGLWSMATRHGILYFKPSPSQPDRDSASLANLGPAQGARVPEG